MTKQRTLQRVAPRPAGRRPPRQPVRENATPQRSRGDERERPTAAAIVIFSGS